MTTSYLQRLRSVGPAVILLSTLLGPVGVVSVAGRTPNVFWCDLLVVAFLLAEGVAWFLEPESREFDTRCIAVFSAFVIIGAASLVWTRDILVGIATLKLRLVPLIALLYVRLWAHRFGPFGRLGRWSVVLAALLGLQIIWAFNLALRGESPLLSQDEVFSAKDLAATTIGRSNYLASIIVLLYPIVLAHATALRSRTWRTAALAALLGCSISLVLTQSRGAILSLVLGGMVAGAIALFSGSRLEGERIPRRWVFPTFLLVTLLTAVVVAFGDEREDGVLALLVPPEVSSALGARTEFLMEQWREGNLSANRESIWREGLGHVFDNPLAGIGLGNQALMMDQLHMENTTHNLYLDTALEMGALGLAVLGVLLLGVGRILYRAWTSEGEPVARSVRFGVLTAFVVALLNAFGEPSFWGPQYGIIMWILIGGATAGTREPATAGKT